MSIFMTTNNSVSVTHRTAVHHRYTVICGQQLRASANQSRHLLRRHRSRTVCHWLLNTLVVREVPYNAGQHHCRTHTACPVLLTLPADGYANIYPSQCVLIHRCTAAPPCAPQQRRSLQISALELCFAWSDDWINVVARKRHRSVADFAPGGHGMANSDRTQCTWRRCLGLECAYSKVGFVRNSLCL